MYPVMMKTPFHEFCLKTGVLCQQCRQRISDGELSDVDLAISKFLITAEYRDTESRQAEFTKSYEGKSLILVKLAKGSLGKIHPAIQDIEKDISKVIGKKALFFEEGEHLQTVVQRFSSPAKIGSTRKSWLPDGTSTTSIKLSGQTGKDLSELSELLSKAYGATINIST